MGRVIKTNLSKYANPNLAPGAKNAVLASIMEYLNGEEFVRIVTAPTMYKSPNFVLQLETDSGFGGATVEYSPTSVSSRYVCKRSYLHVCEWVGCVRQWAED